MAAIKERILNFIPVMALEQREPLLQIVLRACPRIQVAYSEIIDFQIAFASSNRESGILFPNLRISADQLVDRFEKQAEELAYEPIPDPELWARNKALRVRPEGRE